MGDHSPTSSATWRRERELHRRLAPRRGERTRGNLAGVDRRTDVTRASAELDRRLTADAAKEGESRPNGRRIAFEPPLAVIFRVDANATSVVVSQVWEF